MLLGRITTTLLVSTILLAGCSHLNFTAYDSFDEWMVGRDDTFDPYRYSLGLPDGTFAGYVANDILVRTPIYLAHDTMWFALTAVAAPYYTVTYPFRDGDAPAAEPAPKEGEEAESEADEASSQDKPADEPATPESTEQATETEREN